MREKKMTIKKENFRRIAQNRTNKIVEQISKLQNLQNSSFYEYTEEEIMNIFETIQLELDKQRKKFDEKNQEKRNKILL